MHNISITKLLIANRAEIAERIIRTCREIGISTVAVFSDADRCARYVRKADEAIHIGASSPAESYLNIEKIIHAAKISKADAIHPGYGFLAENTAFADRCRDEGIIFIGPSPEVIESMGSKPTAKEMVSKLGIPVIPGYDGKKQDIETLTTEAKKIGFPVLLKAAFGGGGKGMRIVNGESELRSSIESAKREAEKSFGDGTIIIEKYFESIRHIEIQIIGDNHGNYLHCFERECSIQRRHQKIIEESPSPVVTPELREKMTSSAIEIARALKYTSAGTVEFIVTSPTPGLPEGRENQRAKSPALSQSLGELPSGHASSKGGSSSVWALPLPSGRVSGGGAAYYFLEVNTRIQVEHPVTEMITGLDMVRMQIEIAEDRELSVKQEDIKANGNAIECRIYAEDPENNFLPATGRILDWREVESAGVRYDSGVEKGSNVDVFYDPMLAKVITYAPSRTECLRKLTSTLQNFAIIGITNNKEFLLEIINNSNFIKGEFDTNFISGNFPEYKRIIDLKDVYKSAIVAMVWEWKTRDSQRTVLKHIPSGWRNNPDQSQTQTYIYNGTQIKLEYNYTPGNKFIVQIKKVLPVQTDSGSGDEVDGKYNVELVSIVDGKLTCLINEKQQTFIVAKNQDTIYVYNNRRGCFIFTKNPKFNIVQDEIADGSYKAPMPGEIVKILVEPGKTVKAGEQLVVISSMKMENSIEALADGIVEDIYVEEKAFVEADTLLLKVKC
ncbi:MAG: biotin carboxylase N-terminal domain-containing protein [Bacteroidota bacterium]